MQATPAVTFYRFSVGSQKSVEDDALVTTVMTDPRSSSNSFQNVTTVGVKFDDVEFDLSTIKAIYDVDVRSTSTAGSTICNETDTYFQLQNSAIDLGQNLVKNLIRFPVYGDIDISGNTFTASNSIDIDYDSHVLQVERNSH